MAEPTERFGEHQPPIADPLAVREVLAGRLNTLFTLVDVERGTWGAGTEPLRADIRPSATEFEECLVIGGLAQFGSVVPSKRNVGILSRDSVDIGPYFVSCEWPADFDLGGWLELPRSVRPQPLQYTHVVPEFGLKNTEIVDLDLYLLSILNLTTFTTRKTRELKSILDRNAAGY